MHIPSRNPTCWEDIEGAANAAEAYDAARKEVKP
jgi:hypothetical protein